MHEAAGLYGHSRRRVVRPHAQHATRLRQEAFYRGAQDWSDPDWAAAALTESFLLASSDGLNRKQTAEMVMPILDWLGATLDQLQLGLLLLALEESKNSVMGDVLTDKGIIR